MRPWQWTAYALTALVGLGIVAFAPIWYAAQMFMVTMTFALVVVFLCARHYRLPWLPIAGPVLLACFAWSGATMLERASEYGQVTDWLAPRLPSGSLATGSVQSPLLPDFLHLIGHPLAAIATLLTVRQRRAGRPDTAGFLDAALITVACAAVMHAVVTKPILGANLPTASVITLLAYPIADLVILAGMARIAVMPSRWSPSFFLFGGSLLSLVIGDLANSILLLQRHQVTRLSHGAYLLATLFLAAGTTHNSIRMLGNPVVAELKPFTGRRVASLGAAMLIAPAILFVQRLTGHVDAPAFIVFATLITTLVVARVALTVRALERRALLLRRLARTDYLTGLPNRRALDAELERALAKAKESGQRLCIALIDLDHFKHYNDSYGHQAGDSLLASAAQSWQQALREGDMLGRYGGEEFLLVSNHAPARVCHTLDRMRRATPAGQNFSAGVAGFDRHEHATALIARADGALYDAKRGGRARTCVAPASSSGRIPRTAVAT